MKRNTIKANIEEYGFLAEAYIAMPASRALELIEEEGVPSFARIVEGAKRKADLPEVAWKTAERLAERTSRRAGKARLRPRFAVLIALLAVLLTVMLIPATRAYAVGAALRFWSAIVHWDAGYLRVDYNGGKGYEDPPQGEYSIDMQPVDMGESIEYELTSLEELKAFRGGRVLYPYDLPGAEFIKAHVNDSGYGCIVKPALTVNGVEVHYNVIMSEEGFDGEHAAAGFIADGKYTDVREAEIEGVNVIIASGDERCAFSFISGLDFYNCTADTDADTVEALVRSMLRSAADAEFP